MRPLSALLLILPIAMTAAADTNRGQPPATARPMMAKPLSVTQRQFARQFGQRLARNPDYQSVDADWRQFVRGQPRGTDFKSLLVLIRQEAINHRQRELRTLQKQIQDGNRRRTTLGHELAHVRQQRASAQQQSRLKALELQQRREDDSLRLKKSNFETANQKTTQFVNMLSSVIKTMNEMAAGNIRNLR